jgi:hypothetical protein
MKNIRYNKQGKIRSAVKSIGRSIATGLLIAGLMGSPKAFADVKLQQKKEAVENKENPKLAMKFGAAYDYTAKKAYGISIVEVKAGLPYETSISASAGIASAFDNSLHLEELTAFFGFPVYGPVFGDLYFISSRHLGLKRDYGADVGVSTKYGTAIAAVEYVQDAGQVPVILLLKSPSLKGLSISGKGGYVTNKDVWLIGLDLSFSPGGIWPRLELLSGGVVSGQGILYMDSRLTLGWSFR